MSEGEIPWYRKTSVLEAKICLNAPKPVDFMQFHCQLTDCKVLMVEWRGYNLYHETTNWKDKIDMKDKVLTIVRIIGGVYDIF